MCLHGSWHTAFNGMKWVGCKTPNFKHWKNHVCYVCNYESCFRNLPASRLKAIGNRGANYKYKTVGHTAALDLILAVPVNPGGEHIGC